MSFNLRLVVLVLIPVLAQTFQSSPGMLANEPFASGNGALNTTSGGGGWAGGWLTQNNSTSVPGYNVATPSPLSVSGSSFGNYATGGDNWQSTGRALDITPNGAFAAFLASDGSIGKTGTTIFFSILMRKDVNTEDEMSVTLNANASLPWWVNTPGIAIGHFGSSSDSGGVRYWSMRVAGAVYRTSVPVVVGQAAQLVCSVTFGAKNIVSLYLNPPAAALPNTPDATVSTESAVSFRSLEWYAGTVAKESSIDEIRFAGAYASLGGTKTAPPAAPRRRLSRSSLETVRSHSRGPPCPRLRPTTYTGWSTATPRWSRPFPPTPLSLPAS
jgi:hypothetical protein